MYVVQKILNNSITTDQTKSSHQCLFNNSQTATLLSHVSTFFPIPKSITVYSLALSSVEVLGELVLSPPPFSPPWSHLATPQDTPPEAPRRRFQNVSCWVTLVLEVHFVTCVYYSRILMQDRPELPRLGPRSTQLASSLPTVTKRYLALMWDLVRAI